MGWNAGYTAMEAAVIAADDTGTLTQKVLDTIMEPYKHTDCDSGGSMNLKAKDGLGVEEVICKIMEPERYAEIKASPNWYRGEEPNSGNHHGWQSSEAAYDLFWSIWHGSWGIF